MLGILGNCQFISLPSVRSQMRIHWTWTPTWSITTVEDTALMQAPNWSPIEDGNIMKYPTFWLFCTDWGKGLRRMSSFLLPVRYLPCHGHSLLLLYFIFCPPAIASEYETQMQEIFDAELHSMREKLGFWHFVCMDWYGMTCWPEKVLGRGEMYFRT